MPRRAVIVDLTKDHITKEKKALRNDAEQVQEGIITTTPPPGPP